MKTFALTLDLKKDQELIMQYEAWHQNIWPEIKDSIRESGISDMFIYRFRTRLFMLIHTDDDFTFEKKTALDLSNPRVQEWEALMETFQERIEGGKSSEKWRLMQQIFDLNDSE